MKIIHVTDLHIAPVGKVPASRVEASYQDTVWEELNTLKEDIEKESPDVICVTGDIFHYKSPTSYHPYDISRMAEYMDSLCAPVLVIPGNHDLPASSMARLRESPLWLLSRSARNIKMCDSEEYIRKPIYTFVNRGDAYRIWGIPYMPLDTVTSLLRELDRNISDTKTENITDIVMIHADFIPDANVNVFFKVYSQYSLPYLCPHADIFLQGHIHLSFPPLMIDRGFSVPVEGYAPVIEDNHSPMPSRYMISKPWSLGRVVKDYFNTTDILLHQHVPSYAVVTENSIEYKPLSRFRPSSEVFQDDSLKKDVESSKMVSSFVDGLEKRFGSSEKALEIQTPEDMLNTMPSEVRATIQEYLEKAEKVNE